MSPPTHARPSAPLLARPAVKPAQIQAGQLMIPMDYRPHPHPQTFRSTESLVQYKPLSQGLRARHPNTQSHHGVANSNASRVTTQQSKFWSFFPFFISDSHSHSQIRLPPTLGLPTMSRRLQLHHVPNPPPPCTSRPATKTTTHQCLTDITALLSLPLSARRLAPRPTPFTCANNAPAATARVPPPTRTHQVSQKARKCSLFLVFVLQL
jgi:hypothetical protein